MKQQVQLDSPELVQDVLVSWLEALGGQHHQQQVVNDLSLTAKALLLVDPQQRQPFPIACIWHAMKSVLGLLQVRARAGCARTQARGSMGTSHQHKAAAITTLGAQRGCVRGWLTDGACRA